MELPKDIFLGMPLLSMEGNRTLCIVNHRGIIKYCPEVIGIATQSYHIRIVGRSLSIRKYSADLIEISGYMQEITFLPFFKFMCTSRNYVLEDTAGFSDAGFFLYPVAGSV